MGIDRATFVNFGSLDWRLPTLVYVQHWKFVLAVRAPQEVLRFTGVYLGSSGKLVLENDLSVRVFGNVSETFMIQSCKVAKVVDVDSKLASN